MSRKTWQLFLKKHVNAQTIYDYAKTPEVSIKKDYILITQYVARPIFNSIRVGDEKKTNNSLQEYRRYKIKNKKRKWNDCNYSTSKEFLKGENVFQSSRM